MAYWAAYSLQWHWSDSALVVLEIFQELQIIAGHIFEDMIYRGLVMTALEKGKKWGLDVLGSAALFGILHISNHGWVLTDFVFYMGGGLIFAILFRVTKSIYWPIGLHIVYNGIGQILMLL